MVRLAVRVSRQPRGTMSNMSSASIALPLSRLGRLELEPLSGTAFQSLSRTVRASCLNRWPRPAAAAAGALGQRAGDRCQEADLVSVELGLDLDIAALKGPRPLDAAHDGINDARSVQDDVMKCMMTS